MYVFWVVSIRNHRPSLLSASVPNPPISKLEIYWILCLCYRLTKLLLLVAAEREQSLNQAQMTGLQDVVSLTGLQLTGPCWLKVIQPADLILQHGRWAYLQLLHLCVYRRQSVNQQENLQFMYIFNKSVKRPVQIRHRANKSYYKVNQYQLIPEKKGTINTQSSKRYTDYCRCDIFTFWSNGVIGD